MAIIKVKTGGITADAVTDALIADDVVGTEHLTANEVDTAALKADAVTGAELADNAVNSEHYTDGSIDTAHLADGQVTVGKLATAVLTGATDIGAAIADADLFLVDDGAGGTLRKTAASRLKTYVGGGITEADIWRLSASFTGSADPIASNWERADDTNTGYLGSGMSESSGIFTFPSTGIWRVNFNFAIYSANSSGDDRAPKAEVHISPDSGSNYDSLTNVHLHTETISSNYTHNQGTCFCLVDVTNASNFRAKFVVTTLNSGTSTFGQSDKNQTCVEFIRLGDT